MEEREFNLWKFLEIITRRRRFIISFVLIITIAAAIISLLLPKWYEAKTLILPPKEEGIKLGWSGDGIDEIISLTSGIELPVMATPTDVYARILGSRALAQRVIETNRLAEYYEMEPGEEDLYLKVEELSEFRVTPEGLLEVSYLDRDARMAADIANSFGREMDRLNRQIASDRARVVREFLETRVEEVARELEDARTELKNFQNEYKAVDLDRQTQLAIEAAVGLKVSLAENEIELSVKRKTLSATHPEVILLQRRVDEIRRQIAHLEFGGPDSSYLNLPIAEVPRLRVQYAELSSRVAVSETLHKILTEQFEQARIQEKMNTPTISVIDPASPPELAIKPQKRIIVGAAFLLSFVMAVFLALVFNHIEKLREISPEDYKRARYFFATMLGWLPGVKKRFKD
jgi:uncharacterized protein involved in exopolysaccharide biosynthesis